MPTVAPRAHAANVQSIGLVHLAFCPGNEAAVDALTERLRLAGHSVVTEAYRTGDGYYESTVLDPDGNRVEIAAVAT